MVRKYYPYIIALQDVCDYLDVDVKISRQTNEEALEIAVKEIKERYTADMQMIREAINNKKEMDGREIRELVDYIDKYLLNEN